MPRRLTKPWPAIEVYLLAKVGQKVPQVFRINGVIASRVPSFTGAHQISNALFHNHLATF